MRTRTLFFASTVALSALLGSPRTGGTAPHPAAPSTAPAASGPRVALLATRWGAAVTSLYLAGQGEGAPSAPVATFDHLPGATVRGAVMPGTSVVLATADTAETRDLSFNASLFRLAPHAPPERLCDRVAHASRPLVTRDGRVFVSRGAAGPEPASARLADMRVDSLSIDEVDPWTGAARTIHTMSGHLAFLSGTYGREVIVYRVSPAGADIVGVDADTGAVRVIVPDLPPFARDFSIDEESAALVFQGRDETRSHTWTIERVDLASGARSRLHESSSMALIPHALPGGAVAYNPGGREGLIVEGGTSLRAPLGGGADWIQSVSDGGPWIAALHTVQGAPPVPFLADLRSGAVAPLRAPEASRVDIAGFVPSEGGAR